MDSILTGSSIHGILQARTLEWIVIPFSRGSSWPKDWTWVSCMAGRFLTVWATREAHEKPLQWEAWEMQLEKTHAQQQRPGTVKNK